MKHSDERGDTLVEVTIALAILSVVLMGAMLVATTAFGQGQTAKERTQLANEAQQQAEALRSFRDNHTWTEFRVGNGAFFSGIDNVPTAACTFNAARQCFHMQAKPTTAGTTEYVPVAGTMAGSVPTSVIEIWTDTTGAELSARPCEYDFEVHYSFLQPGSSVPDVNHIRTRLANLKYALPSSGAGVCL